MRNSAKSLGKKPTIVWSGLIVFLIALACIALLYWDAASAAASFWATSHNYQHGALLIVVVMAIAGSQLARKFPRFELGSILIVPAILVSATLLALSSVATILLLQMSLLTLVLWLLVWAIFGWGEAKKLTLPFAIVFLAIPFWDFMIVPLQKTTILVVNYLLDVFRRTSYIDGDFVVLRYGTFVVERGCSGMNFFIAGTMLSSLYAYWFLNGWAARLIAIVAGATASIFANWLRVFIIVMAGDLSRMQHSLVDDHIGFGWIVFVLVMGSLLLLEHRLVRPDPTLQSEHSDTPNANEGSATFSRLSWVRGPMVSAVSILAAIALPAVFFGILNVRSGPPQVVSIGLPNQIGDAQRASYVSDPGIGTNFPDAIARESVSYQVRESIVTVDIFAYDLRDREAELVGYPNRWFDTKSWRAIKEDTLETGLPSLYFGPIRFQVNSGPRSVAVVSAYRLGDFVTGSSIEAKVLGTLNYLRGNYVGAAIIVSLHCHDECLADEETITRFAEVLLAGESISLTSESH